MIDKITKHEVIKMVQSIEEKFEEYTGITEAYLSYEFETQRIESEINDLIDSIIKRISNG